VQLRAKFLNPRTPEQLVKIVFFVNIERHSLDSENAAGDSFLLSEVEMFSKAVFAEGEFNQAWDLH
jgi:hypothetical protein